MPATVPKAITVREAASELGVAYSTLISAIRKNETPFPALKIGGRYTIPTRPFYEALGTPVGEVA
ncbi:helix-turn-helix domain-containing protein [Corynebacterium massiliense]|uniref:Helix-turn-helix domain-containing protein n=1 Tax=Corynebacterium massiliense DSM 45435 TaxID=1121364 RepID=A0ABY7U829_9CORY|nr:helix-turn-helix domain-containing protein [Corynebacterium massiliense]WCZ32418.1 hypothetical protein CMASS_04855 [Corynebacterium massiliense DSM 45435]